MNHLLSDDAIGSAHRHIDVTFAGRELVSDVVAEAFMNECAAGRGLLNIDDDGQFL